MAELRTTPSKRQPKDSLATGAPSSPEKLPRSDRGEASVRRTRGQAPKARGGEASRKRGSAAAADDASGLTGKEAASSAATPSARQVYAAAAQPRDHGAAPRSDRGEPRASGDVLHRTVQGDAERVSCDEPQALQDAAAFVDAVSARVSLVQVAVDLLGSDDERIKQRTWERLVNIGPGRGSAREEDQEVIWDMPRPIRE